MLGNSEKLGNVACILLWGVLSTAWCWSAGHALGPTFDEPFYIQAGLKNWHDLNHRELLTQGTMPLAAEVQTLALRLAEIFWSADPVHDWLDWLPIARMGTIVFWWLLLWATFRLGSLYGGVLGGRLAVAMVACEPILLGHASLATTDVAFTSCLTALLAVFRSRRDEPTWGGRLLLPAVFFTLTFLAKASAILFAPICLMTVELERLWNAGWRPSRTLEAWKPAFASMRDLALIGGIGLALLFIVCPRAPRGLLFQIRHNLDGHGATFLFGEMSPHGFWYYFPATLAIKLGLPLFVLLMIILLMRPHSLLNGAILAVVGLLALTPTFRVQIGVRFVLPIAALALIGASASYARWWNAQPAGPRRALAGGLAAVLVLWSGVSSCLNWPNGMCYTNELFGGTRQGHLALSESNIDWGQGLNELGRWQRSHAERELFLWYFGTDPRCMNAPFHAICPQNLEHGEELEKTCRGGYLAASKSFVFGYYHNTPAARYLRSLQPCDQTSTYLIYDLRGRGEAQAAN